MDLRVPQVFQPVAPAHVTDHRVPHEEARVRVSGHVHQHEPRREEAPAPGDGPHAVEEVCGRAGKRVFIITPRSLAGLNLDAIERRLDDSRLLKTQKTRLGLTLEGAKGLTGSVFATGVAVFEGAESRLDAVKIYEKITETKIE